MKNILKLMLIVISISLCAILLADENLNTTTQKTVTTSTTTVHNGDDVIVSAIYSKYAKDSALIGTSLSVSCEDGVVSISGSVTAQSQADEAVIAAKAIEGVKDVRSSIVVTTNSRVKAPVSTPNY